MSTAPVSVVVPLYNGASHIGAALDTAAAQRPSPAEIIVIDDGSTDGGGALVEARADPAILLLRQANAGVAAARNAGLAMARQPLVAFLDADDLWCPGHLARLIALSERFDDAALFGAAFIPAPARASAEDAAHLPIAAGAVMRRADYVAEAAAGAAPFYTSSCMVRRDAAIAEGGFPPGESHGEDMALWIRLSERHGAACVTAPGALYRRSPGGLTGRAAPVPDAAMRTLDLLMPGATPERRAAMARLRDRLALAHALDALARGDRAGARRALAEAGRSFTARRAVARALSALPATAARAAFALRATLGRMG